MTLHYITLPYIYIYIYTYVCVDNEISVYIYIYICNHMYLDVLLSNIIYAKSPCFPRYHRTKNPSHLARHLHGEHRLVMLRVEGLVQRLEIHFGAL